MMQPINNNVLFKPFPSIEKSESGLFLPETAREINNKGTIISIGSKVNGLNKGDVVYRVKNWGEELIIEGEKYFLMDAGSILCKE